MCMSVESIQLTCTSLHKAVTALCSDNISQWRTAEVVLPARLSAMGFPRALRHFAVPVLLFWVIKMAGLEHIIGLQIIANVMNE